MGQNNDSNVSIGAKSSNSCSIGSLLNGLPSLLSSNNSSMVSPSFGSITGSSSIKSLDEVVADVLSRLKLNIQTPDFFDFENRLETYITDVLTPLFSQQFYSVSAGLFLGAAIISGLLVGTALSAGILYLQYHDQPNDIVLASSSNTKRRFTLFSFLDYYRAKATTDESSDHNKRSPYLHDEKDLVSNKKNDRSKPLAISIKVNDDNDDNGTTTVSFTNLSEASLLFIRGDVQRRNIISFPQKQQQQQQQWKSTTSIVLDEQTSISINQCRECFDSIGASLSKHLLSWSDVRKLTVYLVTGQCDVGTFRLVQNEYPFPKDRALTTFLFVQGLEIQYAVVQMEVIAAAASSYSLH